MTDKYRCDRCKYNYYTCCKYRGCDGCPRNAERICECLLYDIDDECPNFEEKQVEKETEKR